MNKTKIFSLFIALFCLLFHLNANTIEIRSKQNNSSVSVIVIDPGHGGKDWGTSIENTKEKEIVLDIALLLGKKINAEFPNIEVIYTRTDDVFIPLHKRADIANNKHADLFISIHVNTVKQPWVNGTETYVFGHHKNTDNLEVAKTENSVILQESDYRVSYKGFDPESPKSYVDFELIEDAHLEKSVMFASYIQKFVKEKAKRSDRSVRQAGFLVLRQINMPGVLIETGFLSNSSERTFLSSHEGKTHLSEAIFDAFKAYIHKLWDKENIPINRDEKDLALSKTSEIKDDPKGKIQVKKPINREAAQIEFSVQIMALKKFKDASPANFKNETEVFVIKSLDFNRYFIGKYKTLAEAKAERKRIQNKFSKAFVVAFENNQLISVKKALGKM